MSGYTVTIVNTPHLGMCLRVDMSWWPVKYINCVAYNSVDNNYYVWINDSDGGAQVEIPPSVAAELLGSL